MQNFTVSDEPIREHAGKQVWELLSADGKVFGSLSQVGYGYDGLIKGVAPNGRTHREYAHRILRNAVLHHLDKKITELDLKPVSADD